MAAVSPLPFPPSDAPELHNGDHMSREEFHRIYSLMPPNFRAELIGGIVYVASPLKLPHGTLHMPLGALLYTYQGYTPGVQSGDNATIMLGDDGEPQPDLFLRIRPECGGQSTTSPDNYILGAPELIVEIAASSRAIDLHRKRDDYTRHGVCEYLVATVREGELRWFDLSAGRELAPEADGIYRLRVFPGLWVHAEGLFADNYHQLMETLSQGLATPEHAAFVQRLAAARKPT